MAALMSKSKVLGICGPIATGDAKLYVDGFTAGAKAAAKARHFKVTAHVVYTGSFSDDSLMATCARYLRGRQGRRADRQLPVGRRGDRRREGRPQAAWFGTQWNQASLAPHNVVASQVYNWVPILKNMFTDIRGGTLGDATYVIGLGNGGEKISFNSGYHLSASVKTAGREADRRDHLRDHHGSAVIGADQAHERTIVVTPRAPAPRLQRTSRSSR